MMEELRTSVLQAQKPDLYSVWARYFQWHHGSQRHQGKRKLTDSSKTKKHLILQSMKLEHKSRIKLKKQPALRVVQHNSSCMVSLKSQTPKYNNPVLQRRARSEWGMKPRLAILDTSAYPAKCKYTLYKRGSPWNATRSWTEVEAAILVHLSRKAHLLLAEWKHGKK